VPDLTPVVSFSTISILGRRGTLDGSPAEKRSADISSHESERVQDGSILYDTPLLSYPGRPVSDELSPVVQPAGVPPIVEKRWDQVGD